MAKEKAPKIVYYQNVLEDEFSSAQITAKRIDESYSYEGGLGRKAARLLLYHGIVKEFAFLVMKVKYGHKIVNQEKLKEMKGKGYFLFGNHTNAMADALIPTMLDFRRGMYVIVHPDNVSMPVFGHITPSLGALPLPDDKPAMIHFQKMLQKLIESKQAVTIYPEAHIWPYCTWIRPFKKTSFGYPVRLHTPVLCFTNTYQKRRFGSTPRIVTYVDGPFYADASLSVGEQKESLRAQVYEAMCSRSRENTVEKIKYVKAEV